VGTRRGGDGRGDRHLHRSDQGEGLHFEGKFYKSRGPLNVPRSPQGKPVFVAPGGSPRGRKIQWTQRGDRSCRRRQHREMKDYRDEVHRHAIEFGRDPKTCKTMFTCVPFIVKSAKDAEEHKQMMAKMREDRLEHSLARCVLSGIDFPRSISIRPCPRSRPTACRRCSRLQECRPRRHAPPDHDQGADGLCDGRTADTVPRRCRKRMDEIGGDGFLIASHFKPRYVTSIVDELVPALQKRQTDPHRIWLRAFPRQSHGLLR